MASWTPRYSTLVSILLDKLVGTRDMIDTRQDYCKIWDCFYSTVTHRNKYYTGSRAEGLDLPGSDDDYMVEINNQYNIVVLPSLDENCCTSRFSTFLMSTENIRPGFTLLQHVPQTPLHSFICQASKHINVLRYLSSDVFIQSSLMEAENNFRAKGYNAFVTVRRQGPSKETSIGISNMEPDDEVDCIRCAFWPCQASEWRDRPRHFGWPTQNDLMSITDFGFHLVPVGHPHSDTKDMEWRISFSIAERTLVWSFNHVQMQCYALMKIILKQFIKVRCSPQNQVLCSYFIKTFLFWKYEATDVNFWREDNLRECINYLLVDFSRCIRQGVLKHYFIPQFNLLSVKLTPAAQIELLSLFDIIIESDISILKDCCYLQELWSMCLRIITFQNESIEYWIRDRNKLYNMINDGCMQAHFQNLNNYICYLLYQCPLSVNKALCQILSLNCKTPLQELVLKSCLLNIKINSGAQTQGSRNKCMYKLPRFPQFEMCSFDISTCKLWYANLLYMTGDYQSTLDIINRVISSIPPYALYHHASHEATCMYRDVFLDSDLTIIQKAKKAWMMRMFFSKRTSYPLPLAIKIELYFHPFYIGLSPFTCLYYLQFMCYYDLRQYENRDRALEKLVEIATHAAVEDKSSHSDLNIAGHCLLLAGKIVEAREMFEWSYALVQQFCPSFQALNSARWYLMNFFLT